MAESNRRGDDAAGDRLDDEVFDDAVDEDTDEPVSRGGGMATRARPKAESADNRPKARDTDRVGIFARIARFFREVVAELRKVIWPGRRELITYTTVVILFVAVMVALVAGLDLLFARGVIAVFG